MRVPEVTSTCSPRRIRRSTTGMSASVSPMLAPCSQARPPCGRSRLGMPRRSPRRSRSSLPRRLRHREDRGGDRLERDEAAAIEAQRQRQPRRSCGRVPRARLVQPGRAGVRRRRRARRRAHARGRARARRRGAPRSTARSSASAATKIGSPSTIAPRPKGRPMLERSQLRKSRRRLVTTATGTIGRPESFASVTMPSPQTRAIFGTSAVSTTISPPSSARSISRSRGDAALLADVAAARAGAADRAHAEMPKRDRVELAVAGARHEARGAVLRALGEMDHEVLAVPHGGDDRHHRPDAIIGVWRLHDPAVGAPDEAEIARRPEPQHLLDRRACGCRRLSHCIVWACQAAPGSSSRCRWTMK